MTHAKKKTTPLIRLNKYTYSIVENFHCNSIFNEFPPLHYKIFIKYIIQIEI